MLRQKDCLEVSRGKAIALRTRSLGISCISTIILTDTTYVEPSCYISAFYLTLNVMKRSFTSAVIKWVFKQPEICNFKG